MRVARPQGEYGVALAHNLTLTQKSGERSVTRKYNVSANGLLSPAAATRSEGAVATLDARGDQTTWSK